LANQLLTSDTVNWGQVATQGAIGVVSGGIGYAAGLQASLNVVRNGGDVAGALNFGNYFGALSGGATQIYGNLPISANYGGFVPATNSTPTPTSSTGGSSGSSADGGFLLYPNMSNTNQMQSVYSKH
jgi:hypothetical protein